MKENFKEKEHLFTKKKTFKEELENKELFQGWKSSTHYSIKIPETISPLEM